MIEIHDNIFSPKLINLIEESVFSGNLVNGKDLSPKWNFRPNLASDDPNIKEHGFGSDFITLEGPTTPNFPFYSQLLYEFCQYKSFYLYSILGGRFFLQSPLIDPTPSLPHYDFYEKDGTPTDGIWVLLYYINDSDGDTIFYKEDKVTELKRVSPKKGRCVFSKNTILHSAGKPTKSPRAIINFNFKII